MTMETTNVVDELAGQLERFHISARLQRLAEATQNLHNDKVSNADNDSKQPLATYSTSRIGGIPDGLPSPQPGCRPVWKPPVLDYSDFEKLIEAQKKFAAKAGNKDVVWRTKVMDMVMERKLSCLYGDWIREQAEAVDIIDAEAMFWYDLDAASGRTSRQ